MLKEFLELVKKCGNDVMFNKLEDKYFITYNDFFGFTEDGEEEFRIYDNELAVEMLGQWLKNNCIEFIDKYYETYVFNDFTVETGYLSFDI